MLLNETTGFSLAYQVKFGGEPTGKVRRELAKLVVTNRVKLLAEWEKKVSLED